jgi:hypothetical protein
MFGDCAITLHYITSIPNGARRLRLDLVPEIPSRDAIRRMLADRVDDYWLSVGMVVGVTDGGNHLATSYGRCDVASGRGVREATIFG